MKANEKTWENGGFSTFSLFFCNLSKKFQKRGKVLKTCSDILGVTTRKRRDAGIAARKWRKFKERILW
jgi:hypothetical protein